MVKRKADGAISDCCLLLRLFLWLSFLLAAGSYANAVCTNGTLEDNANCTEIQQTERITNATEKVQPYIQEVTTAVPSVAENGTANVKTSRALGFDDVAQDTSNKLPSASQNSTEDSTAKAVDERTNRKDEKELDDLSDVTMDEEEEDEGDRIIEQKAKIVASKKQNLATKGNSSVGQCEQGGLTYENGVKLEVDCDQVCTCKDGKMDCVDRCQAPLFRKGNSKVKDSTCIEVPSREDKCCVVLQCTSDTETEPLEICNYKGKSYNRGDLIKGNCEEVCSCETGGRLNCKPRCKHVAKTSDDCFIIPDPKDSCCQTVVCDVTLKDYKLIAAKYVNESTVKLEFDSKLEANQPIPLVDLSNDKNTWQKYSPQTGGYLPHLDDVFKYVKIENTDDVLEIQPLASEKNSSGNATATESTGSCTFKGKSYKLNEEFNDGCEQFCVCKDSGVKCLKMECPTYFGTDVLDPSCIEWETVPPNFKPVAPVCCPEKLQCKNNGSCIYQDVMYQNWQPIPENITGCDKRCYCEMGKVECQNVCPPVTPKPPKNLDCPPEKANLTHLEGDDCCMYWKCTGETKQGNAENSTQIVYENEDEAEPGNETDHNKDQALTTNLPYPFQPTKAPSKTLGPLVVYENPDDGNSKVKLDENHFYSNKEQTKHKKGDKHRPETHLPDEENGAPYLGPFNPNYKPTNKQKPEGNYLQGNNKQPSHIDPDDTPDELLHLIHQHPELSNYPSGSVVEIHNVPIRPPYHPSGANVIPVPGIDPNGIKNKGQSQNIPDPDLTHNKGLTLEQFLHELHSGQLSGHVPYPNNVAQGQPIFVGRPNGPPLGPQGFPPLGHYPGNPQQEDNNVNVQIMDAIDAHTVRLAFTVPRIIVGLHGRVEVRYTHRDDDESSWELQIYAPPNDLIATQQLEFDLVDLRADTEYKIRIIVTLRDLPIRPSSKVYKIRTHKEIPSSTMPAMIPIEPDLVITDINATWVNVAWRKFTEYELQFIDGVQLRFKEIDGKIYAATPLIHRAVTNYTLENLRPNTKYEIGIFFIPFTGQHTELHSGHMWHFTTANEIDTYGFNVTLEISLIKATNVELSWSGVPYPEDKYVNIYRAIYQSDSGKGDSSTFKVAKRDSPPKTSITDLKPGTRYRLWLEIYLTNGKIKTSNVQDFITKPRSAPNLGASSKQDKLSGNLQDEKGDYYGPLVIVAILAAIAILSTLVLLMILVRRHNQNKACITPPNRVSQSAYDNPTYKVEIQQETMDL